MTLFRFRLLRAPSAAFTAAALLLLAPFARGQDSLLAEEASGEDIVDRLNLRGMELTNALALLEQLTGRSVIRPEALPTPKITFDSRGPLTREEAIVALESLLSINGIGLSPLGELFIKVVPINSIRTEAPELVLDTISDRPASGQVVSKLFRLQYLDSQTFQNQIQPFLSPGFSSIIPFQNSNAVIVTDTVSNLQRLEYVVSQVDKPSRLNIETRFYTLQFAQASEVSQQIQSLIENARNRFADENRPGGAGGGGQPQPRGENGRPAGQAGGGGDSAIPMQILFGTNTAIAHDERTNQLIIMTDPSNMDFFDEIIAKLDIKADPTTRIDVFSLRYADAPEVASLLSQFVAGRTGASSRDRARQRGRGDTVTRRRGPFDDSIPTAPVGTPPQGRDTAQDPRADAIEDTLEERDSQFSSFMTIVADERSNAIIVSGTRGDLQLIEAIVDRIDVLLAQVRIEVIIAEINLTKGVSRGSEVIGGIFEDATDTVTLGGPGGSPFNLLGLNLTGSTFNVSSGVSDLLLNAVFERARDDSDIDLLSVPTIVTTHNREANIIVGQAEPIVTGSVLDSNVTGLRNSFQFQDIGIELTVTPLIGPNDVIQLEVEQKIDDVAERVSIQGTEQPIIGRREASSFISVEDGGLIILGGLQRERRSRNRSRPALIGEIPLIGNLFSRRARDYDKTELMIFIHPTVMRTAEDIDSLSRKKLETMERGDIPAAFVETGRVELDKKAIRQILEARMEDREQPGGPSEVEEEGRADEDDDRILHPGLFGPRKN